MQLTVVCHFEVLHVSSTGNTISVWLEKFLVDLSRYHNEEVCDYTTLNQSILGRETAELMSLSVEYSDSRYGYTKTMDQILIYFH